MGLGRKTFNANDILAASDVQGYLMDQSVLYFSDTTSRTNNIGTPLIGMVTSVGGTSVDLYTGSSYVPIYPANISSLEAGKIVYPGTAVTTSITATSALQNGTIWVNTADPVTITIPDVLDLYDTITIHRNAGGTVSIAAGTGVTNWAGAGTAGTGVVFKIDGTYRAAGIQKVAANTYRVVGRIVP
jgi:hypothetical protein